jgi:hypothetical protein
MYWLDRRILSFPRDFVSGKLRKLGQIRGNSMTLKLNDDLRQAIEDHGGAPLYLTDASNNRYVLLRGDQFERLWALFGQDDLDPRAMYPLIDEVMKEDWDDPAMDLYNDYEAHRPPQ